MYWDGDPKSTFTEAYSSHDHWSSEFLAALRNSLSPKRK